MKPNPRQLTSDLAHDARTAMVGVVQIHAQGYDGSDVRSILDPRIQIPTEWTGSGFFIEVEGHQGYILTNSHVVRNATHLQVKSLITSDEEFTAEIVGLVPGREPDIALIRIIPEELERYINLAGCPPRALPLANSGEMTRGLELKAIGYPFDMTEPNVSGGEITNFVSGDISSPGRLITDAAINPGNSGGPAIIEGGFVVGINTAIIMNANNIGFITPINQAKILLPELLDAKEARLAELGANLQSNSKANADYLGMAQVQGLIITHLFPGGTLQRAGLKKRDVLLEVNGHQLDRHGNLKDHHGYRKRNVFDIIREVRIGEKVSITYFRSGKKTEAIAIAYPHPEQGINSQPLISNRHFVEFGGMILQTLSMEIVAALSQTFQTNFMGEMECSKSFDPVILITHLDPESEASRLFLNAGDIIQKVAGEKVTRLEEFVEVIHDEVKADKDTLLIETKTGEFGAFKLRPEMAQLKPQLFKPR